MLLCTWLSYCPAAVAGFLRTGAVSWLVAQTCSADHDDNEYLLQGLSAFLLAICIHFNDDTVENYSKESLRQLLTKRIGVEVLTSKLCEVSRHELYNVAAKHPQLRAKLPNDVLIDYEFCRLFKLLESVVIQSLSERRPENGAGSPGAERASPEDGTLLQYKSLIRQQDACLQELRLEQQALVQENQTLKASLNDSLSAISHLKDENTLLRAQMSAATAIPSQAPPPAPTPPTLDDSRVQEYEAKLQGLSAEVTRLAGELKASQEGQKAMAEELEKIRKDQDDLLELLADQDIKLNDYKMRLLSLGHPVEDDVAGPAPHA